MYGAIENLLKLNLIEEIPSRPNRGQKGKKKIKKFFYKFWRSRPFF